MAEAAAPHRARGSGAAAAPATARRGPASDIKPQVIAFVFDRLTANARATALKAAMTYVDRGHVEGDLVGVFAIDLALRTIQPFTNDRDLIRDGPADRRQPGQHRLRRRPRARPAS